MATTMNGALQDLQFGLRLMRKNPGFSAVVVLLLAAGIGANTVIFSVLDALLLRPLPVSRPHELVRPVRIVPFFFQAGDGIRDLIVTGVQTCALPISLLSRLDHTIDQIRKTGQTGEIRYGSD